MKIAVDPNPNPSEIFKFIKKMNSNILSDRVDLMSYSKKLCKLATCIVIKEKEIVGLSAVYCNDSDKKIAFLTLIGVDKLLRRNGFATKLLDKSLQIAITKNMTRLALEVHRENTPALRFYEKYGFKVFLDENNSARQDTFLMFLRLR